MRFYTVLASRPMYYDRNPLDVIQNYYAGAIAPAGQTTRWTYTVPTARKAYIELMDTHLMRDAAAGTAGRAFAAILLTPSGGGGGSIALAEILTNGVGDQQNVFLGGSGLMQAGDVLNGITRDDSTTGTFRYFISTKATEFDA